MPRFRWILSVLLVILPLLTLAQVLDDNAVTAEDAPVTFSVTDNDSDPDGIDVATVDLDPASFGRQTTFNTPDGDFTVDNFGNVTFTPVPDFNGVVSASYSVLDQLGNEVGIASISVTVGPVNDPPVATDDFANTDQLTPVSFSILVNDTDVDGSLDPSSVDIDPTLPGQQTMRITPNGTFTYDGAGGITFTPLLTFVGVASTQYVVDDNGGESSNPAVIAVTVSDVNDPPVAADDNASANEDEAAFVVVVANDTDDSGIDAGTVDLDPATGGRQTMWVTSEGTFTVDGSGQVTFTPNANFNGPATATYTVEDVDGAQSNEATISVSIISVNDPPVAADDADSTPEDTPVNVSILTNDTDIDGSIDVTSVDLDPSTGGTQTTFAAGNGDFVVDNAGVVTFTPDAAFNGDETINYTVRDDENGLSNIASLTVTVTAVNDAPAAANDAGATNEDSPVDVTILSNDTDDDGSIDPSTVDLNQVSGGIQSSIVTTEGTFTVNGSGVLSFTPVADYSGPASVSYTVQDNAGLTSNVATVTITVNQVNDEPVATNDATTTNENTAVNVNVVGNDNDIDGTIDATTVDLDPATAGIQNTRSTANGDYSVNNTGLVSFTPDAGFTGNAVISYTVQDNGGATSNQATITITVNNVDDPPAAGNDVSSTNEDQPVNVTILGNDTDDGTIDAGTVDLNQVSAGIQSSIVTTEGTFTVNGSGVLSFTPVADYSGSASVSYTVQDNAGLTSNLATVTITVNPVNDAPVATNDATTTNENTAVNVNVVGNDNDIDGTIDATTVDLDPATAGIQNTRSTANGDYSVNNAGLVTFTPDAGFTGNAVISYTVRDNGGATSNQATITITVNNVDDPPVAVSDVGNTNEDQPVNVTILGNDTDDGTIDEGTVDLNQASAGIQNSIVTPEGTFTVNGSGVLTYTPLANFSGSAIVSYTVRDNAGLTSNVATVTITVNAVNDAPVATNDATTTNENTAVNVNVVGNDNDIDGTIDATTVDLDPATAGIQNTRSTANGDYSVNNAGLVNFTPNAGFTGNAVISYTVRDNGGATSNQATITITVNNVDDPPVAVSDVGNTNEDQPVNVTILGNDTDDGTIDAGTVDLNQASAGIQNSIVTPEGTFTVNGSGVLTYTPLANFSGSAIVSYTVRDNAGLTSNVATVTITVNPVNDAPVATNDATTTNENTAVNVNVVGNDNDIDGTIDATTVDLDPAAAGIQNTRSTANGDYSVNNAGLVTFTPDAGFTGNAVISYTVRDNDGATSNQATITITVNNVDDPPVAVNDVSSTNEDQPVNVTILGNDTDDGTIEAGTVDLNQAFAGIQNSIVTPEGTFTVNGSGVLTYTPLANFSGSAIVSYTVRDNAGLTSNVATVTITVNAVNDAPVATNDATTTNENTPVNVNVTTNDTDVEASLDPSSVDLNPSTGGIQNSITTPEGVFSVNASGVVTYTPALNFNGLAQITYTVRDTGGATSNTATLTITVSSVNAAPVAVNDNANTDEDQQVVFNVVANDTDDIAIDIATVDLDPATSGREITFSSPGGTFSVSNSGVVTFTPLANFNGTATAQYIVRDGEGAASNTATITVTVNDVNDNPVAIDDAVITNEDTPVNITILANDSDVDGTLVPTTVDLDVTTAGIQTSRTIASGTYTVNASGVVTFTPIANYNGTSSIRYNVRDDDDAITNNALISVTVSSVNDAPVAVNDAGTTNEGTAVSVNVIANDTDDGGISPATVDLDPSSGGIQSSLILPSGNFSVSTSGMLTYSPTANFNGTVVINYVVSDNLGQLSNVATITITVNSVNEGPSATNDAASTNEDTSVTFNVTANDSDDVGLDASTVDLNTVTAGIQNTRSTAQGNYSVDATGNVTFTPALNYFGSTSISYTVRDGEGSVSNTATITITVNPINDKPVAVADTRTTNEDASATINVVSNDTDVDGTVLPSSVDLEPSVAGVQTSRVTAEGTYSVNVSGVVTFVPANNFFGSSVIQYIVSDDEGLYSDPALITVTVTPLNDPPIAANDIASTDQNVPVTFSLVANDVDVDGTVNAGTVDLNPSSGGIQTSRTVGSGTYVVNASGVVTFTPVTNFSGTSSISYTVQDNAGATSNVATISVLVNFVNQKPVANNDAATTAEDTPVSFNILSNDTDDGSLNATSVDLNAATSGFQNSITTAEGTFSVNNTGVITFTPALNFSGASVINYTVNDNIGETSNSATITVTVTGVNDAPVAVNDGASTAEDTPAIVDITDNDNDVDGTIDLATVDLLVATDEIDRSRTTTQGTFTVDAASGLLTFTPGANFNGSASINYNVRDNNGAKSNNANVTITVTNVNDPPVFNTIENQRVLKNSAEKTITITGISPGPSETEQLLITAVSLNTTLVQHPSVNYSGTGTTATITYKPQLNQSGTAEIVVKAVDSGFKEFSRTFQIVVVDVDITSTPVTLAVPGELYEYNITVTDIPETLSLTAPQKPGWATLSSTGKNSAKLTGTPPANAVPALVTIQLRDGSTVIDQQQFTIEINRRPASLPFLIETTEDARVTIGVERFLTAYSDPDEQPLSEIQIVNLPKHGSLTIGETPVTPNQSIPLDLLSTLAYTPAAEYAGLDTVFFRVKDSFSYSVAPTYFHFSITPVNDAPVIETIEAEPLQYDIGRELAQVFTTQFSAREPDGDMITGAVIGFRSPNYDPLHDLLEFSNVSGISGSYDETLGILTLSGTAPVEDYVAAIRSITYTFVDLEEIIDTPRTLYITLSDGTNTSEARERVISLIYNTVELEVPNVFTPDGNNQNDFWRIKALTGLQQYSNAVIRVFDRRGKMVFETIGFDVPWDGTANGTPVPADTYFYTIDLKYGKEKYTGSVTVLRLNQ